MRLKVGARGSRLSIIQAELVIRELKKRFPAAEFDLHVIRTAGDNFPETPLAKTKRKGIFEKEVDEAVRLGKVDFAVHSMKDVPVIGLEGLSIRTVLKREAPNDVLISRGGLKLRQLPYEATVGTSSPRRRAQLIHFRPDLKIKEIRGNVDTRVRKLDSLEFDSLVLAEAGLARLGLKERITERLPIDEFTPSPGQGAIGVITRGEDSVAVKMVESINHQPSMSEIRAERAFLQQIGGGCKVPVGAVARCQSNGVTLLASVFSLDGSRKITVKTRSELSKPEKAGTDAALQLLKYNVSELASKDDDEVS